MKKSLWVFVAALALLVGSAGCLAPGLFSTQAPWDYDWAKRPDGSVYARDTERNWQLQTPLVQQLVNKEIAAESPPSGKASWPDYWDFYFKYLRGGQENPEKYIAFAVELRRKAGLPELPTTSTAHSVPP